VAGYQRAAAEAITRFGGHVAKYLGDGVMAFFGYPEAHDNDAERAARAGLAILDAIIKLNEQSSFEVRTSQSRLLGSAGAPPSVRPELSARVGIDSGAVVIGAGAGKDADVFGDTSNIAARVQAAAEPGTLVITDATHRLVSGLFVVDSRGAVTLKGFERPVQLYRLIQPSGVRGRLEAAAVMHGLTPFVGRKDELRSLMNRWESVLDGEGQVALIIGEAGIGKSRLLQRFHEQIAGTPNTWIEARAGAFFQNTPFYPVSEIVRQFVGEALPQDQVTQLETRLSLAGLNPVDAIIRTAATPVASYAGRMGTRGGADTAAGDRDRGFTLGRSLDAGADPTGSQPGHGRAAAAPVHGEARVPRTVGDARTSYTNHAQSAGRAGYPHDRGAGGWVQGAFR
jgi:class 3 adenylate cyclase